MHFSARRDGGEIRHPLLSSVKDKSEWKNKKVSTDVERLKQLFRGRRK